MSLIQLLYAMRKRATAQTAHLVFSDTKTSARKTKRAVFCQRLNKRSFN